MVGAASVGEQRQVQCQIQLENQVTVTHMHRYALDLVKFCR